MIKIIHDAPLAAMTFEQAELDATSSARPFVILVADDEPAIRNLLTLILERQGYCVLCAANGNEGLQISRRYDARIDLCLTDVNMPGMNGPELCHHLLEERPGIKVLVMSGDPSNGMGDSDMGFPFLPKPFVPNTLQRKIREVLAAPIPQPELVLS